MPTYNDLGPELLVEKRGDLRILTMNVPASRNAVADELHHALQAVWDVLADDPGARAVVLTGAGEVFSAGGDMAHIQHMHDDPDARRRSIRGAERLLRAMIGCELPVVAAVNGPAVGLGATLALLCDIVVIADDTFMCDPHVSVGVVAGDGGAVVWPLCMSVLHAKEFLLLGDRVPAPDCIRLGLANRAVPAAEVLPTGVALAERLAAQPPQAVRDTKRAVNFHVRQAADLVLDFSLAAEGESFAGDAVLATVRRFSKQP